MTRLKLNRRAVRSARFAIKGILVVTGMVLLGSCSPAAGGGPTSGAISITASSGTVTETSPGNWAFDAGYVATGTSDAVTFTVSNATSADFTGTGSTFTNTDFSDDVSGAFTVKAGQSATFTGIFLPTYNAGATETDNLTFTPVSGTPITIQLKGTSGAPSFFSVLNVQGAPIISTALTGGFGTTAVTVRDSGLNTITFPASPIVSVSNTASITPDTSGLAQTLKAGGTSSFNLKSSATNGATTTVTITGQDSSAGTFYFTFTFTANAG